MLSAPTVPLRCSQPAGDRRARIRYAYEKRRPTAIKQLRKWLSTILKSWIHQSYMLCGQIAEVQRMLDLSREHVATLVEMHAEVSRERDTSRVQLNAANTRIYPIASAKRERIGQRSTPFSAFPPKTTISGRKATSSAVRFQNNQHQPTERCHAWSVQAEW